MNTPVNFELAKLLKEKGFEQKLELGIICRIQNTVNKYYEKTRPIKQSDLDNEWCIFNEIYPTIANVIMWLYEKHVIWVSVDTDINGRFRYILRKYNSTDRAWEVKNSISISEYFNSPTEAYQAALEYCLTELI